MCSFSIFLQLSASNLHTSAFILRTFNMPTTFEGIHVASVHQEIKFFMNNLVKITDTTGEFLLALPDVRVIDTKGWNDWEWTHGIGLDRLCKYYSLTGDASIMRIVKDWFRDRFAAGGTTKNINTMAAFLTLAYLYEETGNKTYLPRLDSADYSDEGSYFEASSAAGFAFGV